MVEITIFVEGGVLPHPNVNAATINNSNRWRESFHSLLSQSINSEKFRLIVVPGGGYTSAIKSFKSALEKGENSLLLINLDKQKDKRRERMKELELENEKYADRMFFMIQEMEAWILSQPEIIEKCFKYLERIKPEEELKNHSEIKGKNPEEIVKPSIVLKTLIDRYFREEKRGVVKKYNKLRDAADLLELLDLSKLENTFSDVKDIVKALS